MSNADTGIAPPRKPALHASILAGLSKCAVQVEHRHVHGRKSPPGVAMIRGTVVHQVGGKDLIHKAEKGFGMDRADILDLARDSFSATWDGEEPLLDEDEKASGVAKVKAATLDETVELAGLFSDEITPKKDPVSKDHVERRLRLELIDFPFDFEGTIDVQEKNGALTDFKTSTKSPSKGAAEGHPQLDAYAMMTTMIDGTPPKSVGLDVMVLKKKGAEVVREKAPAPKTFEHVTARIEAAARVFTTGAFYPVDPQGPSGWVCSPKWCGYYDSICQYGRRARQTFEVIHAETGGVS